MNVFSKYFIDPIKNHYLDFAGKATRTQYWLWVLFSFLVFLVLSIVLGFFGKVGDVTYFICQLAVLLPAIAIGARRLRDAGFSPWWLLLALTGIGCIVLLVFFLLPSKK
ncbi:MAG: DUF805 domain-containing protein [Elusimicrobiaceae bacterium]|nr:DUF805 domain-containing protein [Elusimicrobiaceae bacterium]MBP5617321.1 DUF805 domain-containing protein [Elusimicrobiaceae bacterium]